MTSNLILLTTQKVGFSAIAAEDARLCHTSKQRTDFGSKPLQSGNSFRLRAQKIQNEVPDSRFVELHDPGCHVFRGTQCAIALGRLSEIHRVARGKKFRGLVPRLLVGLVNAAEEQMPRAEGIDLPPRFASGAFDFYQRIPEHLWCYHIRKVTIRKTSRAPKGGIRSPTAPDRRPARSIGTRLHVDFRKWVKRASVLYRFS